MTSLSKCFMDVYPFGEEIIKDNEHPKFRKGDIITNGLTTYEVKGFNRSELGLCYVFESINGIFTWLCTQVEESFKKSNGKITSEKKESNPYNGVNFEYNGHTWGMCARDGGIAILFDSKIKLIIYPEETQPRYALKECEYTSPYSVYDKSEWTIPEGHTAKIEDGKIIVEKKQ